MRVAVGLCGIAWLLLACGAQALPQEAVAAHQEVALVAAPDVAQLVAALPALSVAPDEAQLLVTLATFEPRHPWHDSWEGPDGTSYYDDGEAPMATFTVVWPETLAGQEVAVLFLSGSAVQAPTPMTPGQAFVLVLPAEALTAPIFISNEVLTHLSPLLLP